MNIFILQIMLMFHLIGIFIVNRGCEVDTLGSPKFKLLKRHARSEANIVTRKEFSKLEECLEFAIAKRALAFNFAPSSKHKKHSGRNRIGRLNCQVLGCPEISSWSSLIEDKKFNYYSAYPRKLTIGNDTAACLSNVGVFVTVKKPDNYTNAELACEKIHGKLAHVVSEERTEGLSQFIFNTTPVYVGLSNRGKEHYWKNEFGKKLEYFEYRGWAPGEPASRGCVTLIRSEGHGTMHTFWKVVPCSQTFSFICEILPRLDRPIRNVTKDNHGHNGNTRNSR